MSYYRLISLLSTGMLLVCGLLLSPSATAQVAMEMSLNHMTYLQFEPITAKITIRNFSGHPLIFGANKELSGKLSFQITGPTGTLIELKENATPSLTGLLIETGKTQYAYITVSKFYSLLDLGRYTIRAIVTHPQMNRPFTSNTVGFTVAKGNIVWEHLVGVPELLPEQQKPNEPFKERRYRIYSLYDDSRNYFYLSVEDDDLIYSLQRIGMEMSRNSPECEVDRFSRLHLLMPTNPRVSTYFVFGPDGKQEKRMVYRKTTTVPTLVRNAKTGEVIIAGGQEARAGIDYQDEYADTKRPTTAEQPEINAVPELPAPAGTGTDAKTTIK